jgi:hypothetical protein
MHIVILVVQYLSVNLAVFPKLLKLLILGIFDEVSFEYAVEISVGFVVVYNK